MSFGGAKINIYLQTTKYFFKKPLPNLIIPPNTTHEYTIKRHSAFLPSTAYSVFISPCCSDKLQKVCLLQYTDVILNISYCHFD